LTQKGTEPADVPVTIATVDFNFPDARLVLGRNVSQLDSLRPLTNPKATTPALAAQEQIAVGPKVALSYELNRPLWRAESDRMTHGFLPGNSTGSHLRGRRTLTIAATDCFT
jgi:hypothetical protein